MVKNMIEPTIVGSIQKCETVTEYVNRIKSQFHGSSKAYVTQLINHLMIEKYYRCGNSIVMGRDGGLEEGVNSPF